MPHLHLVIDTPDPGDWHGRLDVSEALEAAGWTGDDDGQLLGMNGAFWGVTNQADDSSLTCPNDTVIDFPSDTPTIVVVAACLAAAAEAAN
ncbi:hypothetical protein [Streptomyces sp. NPDC007991]|uniref:hypothetical protein n=1 Tax=Streptomyces sp. NPDC007991 TaxID=3364803 RepID=UPI0036E8DD7B